MNWLNMVRTRLRALLEPDKVENERENETRFHIEMQTAEEIPQGMNSEEARREAPGVRLLEDFVADIRYAARALRASPRFTVVTVLTLALGIGANSAIFSVVKTLLLRPLPYGEADRLVMLWERDPQRGMDAELVTPLNFIDWRDRNTSFEQITFFFDGFERNLVTDAGAEPILGVSVASGLFPMLGVRPMLGRGFTSEEDLLGEEGGVVILSHELWQRRFGARPNVLGETITLDNYNAYAHKIIGVMPPGFQFPEGAELWLPTWLAPGSEVASLTGNRRSAHWLSVLGRLKPGVSIERAQAEMNAIQQRVAEQNPDANIGTAVKILPLRRYLEGDIRSTLLVLWSAVSFVLLIACANVANLLLARASAREGEITTRVALGATRGRIVRQLLTESMMLSLIGGLLGLLTASVAIDSLLPLAPGNVRRLQLAEIDIGVLGYALVLSVGTGVMFGLAPALQCTRRDMSQRLREVGRGLLVTRGGIRLRSGLVVSQIALALILLIGSGLMVKSFARLQAISLGFRPENVLTMDFDLSSASFNEGRRQAFFHELMRRVEGLPGVISVGGTGKLPLSGRGTCLRISVNLTSQFGSS